jgi:hypothetical protein
MGRPCALTRRGTERAVTKSVPGLPGDYFGDLPVGRVHDQDFFRSMAKWYGLSYLVETRLGSLTNDKYLPVRLVALL